MFANTVRGGWNARWFSGNGAVRRAPLPTFVRLRAQGCGSGYMFSVPAASVEGRKLGVRGERMLPAAAKQQALRLRNTAKRTEKNEVLCHVSIAITRFSWTKSLKKVKFSSKKEGGSGEDCGRVLSFSTQPSPVTLREACAGPQVQRVHEAYFHWACSDRPH